MAKKSNRYKKIAPVKVRDVPKAKENRHSQLDEHDLEEGAVANELLRKRSTAEFSRTELSALMQTAPGGAEPHHIKIRSRQFRRQTADVEPLGAISEGRTHGHQKDLIRGSKSTNSIGKKAKPVLSENNYKIDAED